MEKRAVFCCDICGKKFGDKVSKRRCESAHYNMTPGEYDYWQYLCYKAALAEVIDPKVEFKSAVMMLCDFEDKHGRISRIRQMLENKIS